MKNIRVLLTEYLDQKPQTHYEYYLDNINFGGTYIRLGRYKNYDKMSKTFDMLMFQIRVNPNKYMHDVVAFLRKDMEPI